MHGWQPNLKTLPVFRTFIPMAKHIGIVGCSSEGAALCYRTICLEGSDRMGMHAHPEISMHTHSLREYMEHINRNRWDGVAGLMLSSAGKLKSAGADFLICPDNTIHEAFPYVEKNSPLPWLHIARVTVAEAVRRGLKRPAVLGTRYLIGGPVYSMACRDASLDPVFPPESAREKINCIIFEELVHGEIREGSRKYLIDQIGRYREEGCDCVILGCTELPLIVTPEESPLPVLDSTRILARAALDHALEN
jgi:aspartate racemase